ncbi:MAG: ketoacyl-ACP synthase III [Anaerolineae bacterium]|nr:ketoacyl-ACP synthase III [Anaerolineae bacterium]
MAAPERAPGLKYAHIVGWGMAVPERTLTNDDLAAFVDTSDEWIRTRTGIHERRIAGARESTATLGLRAAQAALDLAGMLPGEIDLIVVATSTPDYVFPSTASLIQGWIGATRAGAFDLSAACTGFVYALEMASQAIRAGSIEAALVVGAETMTRVLDWSDRNTCVLFGDGAGAVALRAADRPGGVLACTLGSDGSGADLLAIPNGSSGYDGAAPDGANGFHKLSMDGRGVFRFATRIIGAAVTQALEKAGVDLDEVALIVPHQANQRIIEAAAKQLKVSSERFFSNLASYGNTSAASIPIALCEAVEQGRIRPADKIVLVGFGGGLTWGAAALEWPEELPPEPDRWDQRRRGVIYTLARLRSRLMRQWWRVQVWLAGGAAWFEPAPPESQPQPNRLQRFWRRLRRRPPQK